MVVASVASLRKFLHHVGWCPSKDYASRFDTLKQSLTRPRFLFSIGIIITLIFASLYTLNTIIFPLTHTGPNKFGFVYFDDISIIVDGEQVFEDTFSEETLNEKKWKIDGNPELASIESDTFASSPNCLLLKRSNTRLRGYSTNNEFVRINPICTINSEWSSLNFTWYTQIVVETTSYEIESILRLWTQINDIPGISIDTGLIFQNVFSLKYSSLYVGYMGENNPRPTSSTNIKNNWETQRWYQLTLIVHRNSGSAHLYQNGELVNYVTIFPQWLENGYFYTIWWHP